MSLFSQSQTQSHSHSQSQVISYSLPQTEIDLNSVNFKTLSNVLNSLIKSSIIGSNSIMPISSFNERLNEITITHILHRIAVLIQLIKQRQSIDSHLANFQELKCTFEKNSNIKYLINKSLQEKLTMQIKNQIKTIRQATKQSNEIDRNAQTRRIMSSINQNDFSILQYGCYLSNCINLSPDRIRHSRNKNNMNNVALSNNMSHDLKTLYDQFFNELKLKSNQFEDDLSKENDSTVQAPKSKKPRNSTVRKKRRDSFDDD